jgi:AAA domain (dynein-related subfamily)
MAAINLGDLLELYDKSEETREAVQHNIGVLKCIRGGLRMAERHRFSFRPRQEYWRLPERRIPLAYFAERWSGRFFPARSLRIVAQRVLSHFDQARTISAITFSGVNYEEVGGLGKICETLADHARRLAPIPEWEQLRGVWPKIAQTAAEDVAEFLLSVPNVQEWEASFRYRYPWFGYLGTRSAEDLRNRQSFFFGFANLWTTTNAYVHAGAQGFAPVIGNTPTDIMLDAALTWIDGKSPIETSFRTFSREDLDDEPQDRSLFATVVEVYGFLNLERAPFYNNLAETYRDWFGLPKVIDPYEMTARVGKVTAEWLGENPEGLERVLKLFRKIVEQKSTTRVEFEAVNSPKIRKHSAFKDDDRLDVQLSEQLEADAKSELMKLGDLQAAAIALHLLLDSKVYLASIETQPPVTTSLPTSPIAEQPTRTFPATPKSPATLKLLPAALRPYGELALAYLKAGFHVLFAGAPGTGKTTVAQFVGHAWDRGMDLLPEYMPPESAPLTTVGNSAWSPFHTIGGLMPTGTGTFKSHAGIFIDPSSTGESTWRLRNGTIVLDEMNRADLDRCIGELYPLLSGSVERVFPAGLPNVTSIETSSNFRVIATVNDAHLDDIVFPISEGLARRFQRIELPGGSMDEVLAYLRIDGPKLQQDARREAANDAVRGFFDVAREHQLLQKFEDDDRLPLGVAYFSLLKAWIEEVLKLPLSEATLPEQARDLLTSCLRTLGKSKKWTESLRSFQAKG